MEMINENGKRWVKLETVQVKLKEEWVKLERKRVKLARE